MTPDWDAINEATRRAIDHMREAIRWAEVGKKHPKQATQDDKKDEAEK